jgi:outer membrane murein-binding lipoprotein Lpp
MIKMSEMEQYIADQMKKTTLLVKEAEELTEDVNRRTAELKAAKKTAARETEAIEGVESE